MNKIKKYRARNSKYETVSLTLEKELVDKIEKKVNETDENNMSNFIEETVGCSKIKQMPVRRKFKTYPVKKTFTFTEDFVSHIKKSGNMSLFVEEILSSKI